MCSYLSSPGGQRPLTLTQDAPVKLSRLPTLQSEDAYLAAAIKTTHRHTTRPTAPSSMGPGPASWGRKSSKPGEESEKKGQQHHRPTF